MEVVETVPEVPETDVLEAEVLKPEASEPGSLEVCLVVVVGRPVLALIPQRRWP